MSGTLGFALLAVVSVSIWWRNHDILSDLYDYSSIIASAGKIEAGLKPYVDFRSTMQSSTYLLNRGAEVVFGRNYLGLTLGGLVFSLAGALALFALLRRSFGLLGGLLLTAAVAWSGLGQHVVVFYNPVGILCLAIVVIGVAQCPGLSRPLTWDRGLVVAALILGGLNKINFQCLGLALAAVLVLHAHLNRQITRRDAVGSLLILIVAGVVVPLTIELAWTGASPALWFENVVVLAGERVDYIRRLADPAVYAGPAHDLHHHIPFKRLTAIGLALLAGVAFPAVRATWRGAGSAPDRLGRTAILILFVAGTGLGGVLLTITNVETIALTSLGFVIGAAALWITTAPTGTPGSIASSRVAWLLPAAGMFWAVNGGVAAWKGSRVLFARVDADRSVFVRLQDAPPALRYLEGVRLDANLHRSLLIVARELERLEVRNGDMKGVLFGSTFEWLERSFPEAIQPGMPVWYHVGTALRADDGAWLIEALRRRGVDRILTHPGWESWPEDFRTELERKYRSIAMGGMARLYEKVGSEHFSAATGSFSSGEPLAMIERTGSNLHLLGAPVPAGFDFMTSPWGDFIGRANGWEWNWSGGLSIVEGVMVLKRPDDHEGPVRISVRAVTTGQQGAGEILWQEVATLDAGQVWARLPFRITPYGQPLRFHVEAEPGVGEGWLAGCREIQIRQTIELNGDPPPPTVVASAGIYTKMPDGKSVWLRAADSTVVDLQAWHTSPLGVWTQRASGSTAWKVTLETEGTVAEHGTSPVVMLLWYRSGRIELLSQQAIERQSPREVSFEGWMPEPGGWLGVAVRPMERGKQFNVNVRVKEWVYQAGL